ncbi:MAG: hypothetical protein IJS61_04370 [Firmicutes bacterium]|nr:hypothetical protein [Bacillota bacterium]
MKKEYNAPKISITELNTVDIITSSAVANLANSLSSGKSVKGNYLFDLNS